jgi:inner membrane protein
VASAFTHAFVAVAAGTIYARERMPRRFWITSVALSILPDLDVIGFAWGIRYGDFLGHRGFSHSLAFAMLAGAAVLPLFDGRSWRLWLYFFAVTASHGFLDAMTDGGLGVAFFSPLDLTRYFLPWTPVRVSPIGIAPFFSEWGLVALGTEIAYVWAPVILVAAAVRFRRSRKARVKEAAP